MWLLDARIKSNGRNATAKIERAPVRAFCILDNAMRPPSVATVARISSNFADEGALARFEQFALCIDLAQVSRALIHTREWQQLFVQIRANDHDAASGAPSR
jgi:hypothetical protein